MRERISTSRSGPRGRGYPAAYAGRPGRYLVRDKWVPWWGDEMVMNRRKRSIPPQALDVIAATMPPMLKPTRSDRGPWGRKASI